VAVDWAQPATEAATTTRENQGAPA
jgi:hypothetical protein